MNKKKIICYTICSLFLLGFIILCIYGYNNIDKKDTDIKSSDSFIFDLKYGQDFEKEWNNLGDSQKYFELGSEHFYLDEETDEYKYTDNFVLALFKLCDGYYKDARTEDFEFICNIALAKLIDKGDAKEVCFEFYKITQEHDKETFIEGLGRPLIYLDYLAESYGYKEGDTVKFGEDTFKYIGCDKWVNSSNIEYISYQHGDDLGVKCVQTEVASTNNSNTTQNSSSSNKNNSTSSSNKNSKYVSEQWGYSKGDTAQTTADGVYTYLGNDIWQDTNGSTYKARLEGNNIVFYEKSPYGVSSATDEDGYMLPGADDTPTEDPDKDSRDPSGWRIGTAGWHEYWDGKTVKEFHDNAGYTKLYYIVKPAEGNRLPTTEYYPDDYVIGSYALICEENIYTGEPIYGKY